MTIDQHQFRDLICRTLQMANMYSPAAVELLMGTAAHESHLGTYLKQISGPALGFFQMEPETERDIWDTYLRYRDSIASDVVRTSWVALPSDDALESNIRYQIIMARLKYLRVPAALPPHDDIHALAEYWDKHYNCNPAKGFPEQFVEAYNALCPLSPAA